MRINTVTVRMSAHVAQRLLELVVKETARKPDDATLDKAHDELSAALADRT